jgi:hypothetical protein
MILNKEDADRFYRIWLSLIKYTNHKYKLVPDFDNKTADQIDPYKVLPVKNALWKNDYILEEVYRKNPFNFPQKDLEIIRSWQNRVEGKFIIVKHLKEYTILMNADRVYGVKGIISPIKESYPTLKLPTMVEAVLIPFEGQIIYDSIMQHYNVNNNNEIIVRMNSKYLTIKENYGVITSLD